MHAPFHQKSPSTVQKYKCATRHSRLHGFILNVSPPPSAQTPPTYRLEHARQSPVAVRLATPRLSIHSAVSYPPGTHCFHVSAYSVAGCIVLMSCDQSLASRASTSASVQRWPAWWWCRPVSYRERDAEVEHAVVTRLHEPSRCIAAQLTSAGCAASPPRPLSRAHVAQVVGHVLV